MKGILYFGKHYIDLSGKIRIGTGSEVAGIQCSCVIQLNVQASSVFGI
jgi:hypothetical protein